MRVPDGTRGRIGAALPAYAVFPRYTFRVESSENMTRRARGTECEEIDDGASALARAQSILSSNPKIAGRSCECGINWFRVIS